MTPNPGKDGTAFFLGILQGFEGKLLYAQYYYSNLLLTIFEKSVYHLATAGKPVQLLPEIWKEILQCWNFVCDTRTAGVSLTNLEFPGRFLVAIAQREQFATAIETCGKAP